MDPKQSSELPIAKAEDKRDGNMMKSKRDNQRHDEVKKERINQSVDIKNDLNANELEVNEIRDELNLMKKERISILKGSPPL